MAVKIDDRSYQINVLKIKGDGSCLFASVIHQLECVKVDTEEHFKQTAALRQKVVQHIKENIDKYKQTILCRDDVTVKDKNEDKACEEFLDELSKSTFWGGMESLLAVANLYSVNIFVFNEKGPCYFATGFNPEFKQIIFLGYRIGLIKNKKNTYNHYDSICAIDVEILYKCASNFSENLSK